MGGNYISSQKAANNYQVVHSQSLVNIARNRNVKKESVQTGDDKESHVPTPWIEPGSHGRAASEFEQWATGHKRFWSTFLFPTVWSPLTMSSQSKLLERNAAVKECRFCPFKQEEKRPSKIISLFYSIKTLSKSPCHHDIQSRRRCRRCLPHVSLNYLSLIRW